MKKALLMLLCVSLGALGDDNVSPAMLEVSEKLYVCIEEQTKRRDDKVMGISELIPIILDRCNTEHRNLVRVMAHQSLENARLSNTELPGTIEEIELDLYMFSFPEIESVAKVAIERNRLELQTPPSVPSTFKKDVNTRESVPVTYPSLAGLGIKLLNILTALVTVFCLFSVLAQAIRRARRKVKHLPVSPMVLIIKKWLIYWGYTALILIPSSSFLQYTHLKNLGTSEEQIFVTIVTISFLGNIFTSAIFAYFFLRLNKASWSRSGIAETKEES